MRISSLSLALPVPDLPLLNSSLPPSRWLARAGYLVTARMIAEVGLLLSQEREELPQWARQGGVLTSATIGGERLAERLKLYAGFDIETAVFEEGKDK